MRKQRHKKYRTFTIAFKESARIAQLIREALARLQMLRALADTEEKYNVLTNE